MGLHVHESGAGERRVVPLPGAGHEAHRAAPEAFAGLVRRGLELAARPGP